MDKLYLGTLVDWKLRTSGVSLPDGRDSHTFITLVAAVGYTGGIYRRSTVTFVTTDWTVPVSLTAQINCDQNGPHERPGQ